jgi:hypothetical protein
MTTQDDSPVSPPDPTADLTPSDGQSPPPVMESGEGREPKGTEASMIPINEALYDKLPRGAALAILLRAGFAPDQFVAHRDGTYSAFYLRERQDQVVTPDFEARLEIIDRRVAILKRPSPAIDRGQYLTVRFAIASAVTLGITIEAPLARKPADEFARQAENPFHASALRPIKDALRDLTQLIDFANDLAGRDPNSPHLLVTLEEMRKHVSSLSSELSVYTPNSLTI